MQEIRFAEEQVTNVCVCVRECVRTCTCTCTCASKECLCAMCLVRGSVPMYMRMCVHVRACTRARKCARARVQARYLVRDSMCACKFNRACMCMCSSYGIHVIIPVCIYLCTGPRLFAECGRYNVMGWLRSVGSFKS